MVALSLPRANNLEISALGPIGEALLALNCLTLIEALNFVRNLEYGRIDKDDNILAVLTHRKGTCSSKHLLIKELSNEQQWQDVQLILCLYNMSEENTPGIHPVLTQEGLENILEAHTYLSIGGQPIDITNPNSDLSRLDDDILERREMNVTDFLKNKVVLHRKALATWAKQTNSPYTFEKLWSIREECISALSANQCS